jgi:hypothetical protein
MALSDLEVFQEYSYSAMTEVLAQQVDLFNGATNGGIRLQAGAHQGDYSDRAMWQKISGLVRRRNAYGSGAVTEKNLVHILDTSVKVGAGTAPVRIDPGMFQWIQRSPEEAGAVIGQQMAKDALADMLNVAIGSYAAAIAAQAALYNDQGGSTATLGLLNSTRALLGDAAEQHVCWIMHSKSLFDIYGTALANAQNLFEFGNVRVVHDGFGRPLVVTDSANLILTAPTPDEYYILGPVAGGITVDQNNDFLANVETKNGDENIIRTYQAQWSYQLALKGFAWDKTNGGPSPTTAALVTGTNWDKYVTSHKDCAGVLLQVT